VVGLGEDANVRRQQALAPGVQRYGYRMPPPPADAKPGVLGGPLEAALRRAFVVARAARRLREQGFRPDAVCAHNGWGEGIFLKDELPEARFQLYCEFFYNRHGADVGFDPEFPPKGEVGHRLRLMNAPILLALEACDAGLTATRWQRAQFPEIFRARIEAAHEGIDTKLVAPRADAVFEVPEYSVRLTAADNVVTYTTRNFEPYRGFHIFMRAVPGILERCPQAHVVIVGNDHVSYSPRLPQGQSYRLRAMKELEGRLDLGRVHFLPSLTYERYLSLLQVSSAHVYLTYPFVLSWSLLEAMSAGCLVIASRTAPVEEVVRDGENGVLFDFFSPGAIVENVERALKEPGAFKAMRERAREFVVENYDLESRCLPRQVELLEKLAAG